MPKWSKEDVNVFNRSEVMREYEKLLINSALTMEKLIKLSQEKKLDETNAELDSAIEKAEKLKGLLGNAAEDGEVLPGAEDSKEDPQAKEDMINDLTALAREAAEEGNYKVAYKIERAITEILEGE